MKTVPERDERLKRTATEWVHFCRFSSSLPMRRSRWDLFQDIDKTSLSARILGQVLLLAFPCWLVITTVRALNVPMSAAAVCCGIVVVLFCVKSARKYILFDSCQRREGVPDFAPRGSRLHCIGIPSKLPMLADMPSVPFESKVYKAPFPISPIVVSLTIAVLVAHVNLLVYRLNNMPAQMISGGIAVGIFLLPMLISVYYRVSPRSLEVLYYVPLRVEPFHITVYDLRRAYIVADFRHNRVTIGERTKPAMSYLLWFMLEREDFVHRLFLAAISKYRSPTLPADTL